MPMNQLMALRLGRPDLAGKNGSISIDMGSANNMSVSAGPSTGGGVTMANDVSVGRVGLSALFIVVGAMAIAYITTRRIQF